jgi:hypothetical protein
VRALVVAPLVALALLTGCSSGSKSTSVPTTTTHIARPVSATASVSAKMICEKEAVDDIYTVTGAKTVAPFKSTWVDDVYSCDYVYPNGAVMRLAVKELTTGAETTGYYNLLATKLGKTKALPELMQKGLAQDAFATKGGSIVARKDYKVLLIDVSKLPERFGAPTEPRSDIAVSVGATILDCWTGL